MGKTDSLIYSEGDISRNVLKIGQLHIHLGSRNKKAGKEVLESIFLDDKTRKKKRGVRWKMLSKKLVTSYVMASQ